MKLVAATVAAVLLASPLAAQSRVTDIYAQMAANAARRAEAQAAIRSRTITELFDLPVAILEQRPVDVRPVAPIGSWVPSFTPTPTASPTEMQRYLQEALDYQKEQDLARRALFTAVVPEAAGCGLKPLKPLPPLGCRDLVAQCVMDASGHGSWQWICVK